MRNIFKIINSISETTTLDIIRLVDNRAQKFNVLIVHLKLGAYSAALSIRLTRVKPRGPPKAGAHATF